jgi:hypothetical protein
VLSSWDRTGRAVALVLAMTACVAAVAVAISGDLASMALGIMVGRFCHARAEKRWYPPADPA